jgi:hypothetical protein
MNPMYSIPAPHEVTVTPAGLLNSPDLITWLQYGLVLLLAGLCMPQVVKDGLAQLWEPGKDFLARLHVSLLVGWCFAMVFIGGTLSSQMVQLGIACSDDSDLKPAYLGGRRGDTGFRYAAGT